MRSGGMVEPAYPITPDQRYFVAKGCLWRRSDPRLGEAERDRYVKALMAARRNVRDAATEEARKRARSDVHAAKVALGERGPVWWADGTPDRTRYAPKNTRYAAWWAALPAEARQRGEN
jgi:hypothetical protein